MQPSLLHYRAVWRSLKNIWQEPLFSYRGSEPESTDTKSGQHLKKLERVSVLKSVTKRESLPLHLITRKRVAVYARVSSGKDAMFQSLSAQISYYSAYIQRHIEWEFAGVYADEAITGTKDRRTEFQRLLADCRAGKIDMVITKSITRFARNTLTTLETVRELKLLSIDVFFEKEKIHSIGGDGELMLSILASFAQEESRSVSENCKWRIRKDFSEGKLCSITMLGYRTEKGKLVVIPEEAVLVQAIFKDYLSGMGILAIVKKCRKIGILLSRSGLSKMLRNEKYCGELLLQKTFIADHLSKKKVKNTGQLPKYHVKNSHEPIIDRKTFDAVQTEIRRRSKLHQPKRQPLAVYPFSGMIRCGKCGAPYKRKHANAGGKYEKIVWICSTFNNLGKSECDSQQISEKILIQKVEEVDGLENIAQIRIPDRNRLTFILKDGRVVDAQWQNPSRRESWTPKMKQTARERQLKKLEQRRRSM